MIYKYPRATAIERGELDLYRESRKENIACRHAIEEAINTYHQNNILDDAGARNVIANFGYDRTMWVLAASICYHKHDGRFSRENKEWAKAMIPSVLTDRDIGEYAVNSHPTLLNGFTDQVQREYAKLGLYSSKNCLKDGSTLSYENQLLVLKPEILKEQYKNPACQLFFAESGFGCYPDRIGSKVFGRFLCDGERAQFWRSDFIGIADYKYLPDWAMTRVRDLLDPKMKIRIFQLKSGDTNAFMSLDFTNEHGGIKAGNYKQIWGGTMVAAGLEDIFTRCNIGKQPPGYNGHSLSVSDIIEICEGKDKGFYFVDGFGYKKVEDFDIEHTDREEVMKVLILENDKMPYEAEINHNIHALQHIVGGLIEPVYFEPKNDALCWCNEEFLLNGSAPNRIIGNTLIHGTCFICGDGFNEYGERDSMSLTDEQISKYTEQFISSVVYEVKPSDDESEDMSSDEDISME
ncbi:MAG: DUF3849 domain-containing protein [Ruminococcus sp.]|nr:DUF3849 domain-containing protein [Ruminococcus sp.]